MLKVVLVLLAVSTVAGQVRYCPGLCEICDPNFRCRACLKSRIILFSCYPTDVGNCLIYGQEGCEICEPGYSLLSYQNSDKKDCIPNTIKNCQVSEAPARTTQALSQQRPGQRCFACAGGYPTKDRSACVDFKKEDSGLTQRDDRCLYGGRRGDGETFCYRCKAGYVVYKGECYKSDNTGCLEEGLYGNCFTCDFFAGYFKKTQSTCWKGYTSSVMNR